MTVRKIPTLDSGNLIFDKFMPARLGAAQIAADRAAAVVVQNATFAPRADFDSQAGVGGTNGRVIVIGPDNSVAPDVGTAGILGGGSPNYENVIGGITASVNTTASNLPHVAGTGASWSWIVGGYDNVVNGWACMVSGFHNLVEATANHCTIAGGSIHRVLSGAAYSSIGGGTSHLIGANANSATIAGGNANEATANNTFVGGGNANKAQGNGDTVAGGLTNTASGTSSTVSGGGSGVASGIGSTVTGGSTNTASGRFSTAIGREAIAALEGEVGHASGRFLVPGDAQSRRLVARRLSTTATAGDMSLDGGTRFPDIPDNTTWAYRGMVAARTAAGESAAYEFKGAIKRNAGVTAMLGTPTITVIGEDVAAWDFTVAAGSGGVLRLVTTGEAGKTIRWVASIDITQVSF